MRKNSKWLTVCFGVWLGFYGLASAAGPVRAPAPRANLSLGSPVLAPVGFVGISLQNSANAPLGAPSLNLNGTLLTLEDAALPHSSIKTTTQVKERTRTLRPSVSRKTQSAVPSVSETKTVAHRAKKASARKSQVPIAQRVLDTPNREVRSRIDSSNPRKAPLGTRLQSLTRRFDGATRVQLNDTFDLGRSADRKSVSATQVSKIAGVNIGLHSNALMNASDAPLEPPTPKTESETAEQKNTIRTTLGKHWKTFAAMGTILAVLGSLFYFAGPLVEIIAATEMSGLNVTTGAIAVLAGVLSFASPCTLPLLPGFMATISGLSYDKMQDTSRARMWRTGMSSLAFVAGASTIFLAMGALASTVGAFLFGNMPIISKFAGGLLVLFGLHTMGVKIPWLSAKLNIQKSMDSSKVWGSGYLKAFLIGMVFAIGWSPCIGPILGMILGLASTAGVAQGTALLGLYSLGLGIPFILTGLFIDRFQSIFSQAKKMFGWRERIAGAIMILLGIALAFGNMATITDAIVRMLGIGA